MAIASEAGADVTDAASRCVAGAPIRMYAPSVEPATEAKPPAITQCSCESFRRPRIGRTSKGASVCPRKMLATAQMASARETPSNALSAPPSRPKTTCSTPTWRRTEHRDAKKMVTESTMKAQKEERGIAQPTKPVDEPHSTKAAPMPAKPSSALTCEAVQRTAARPKEVRRSSTLSQN